METREERVHRIAGIIADLVFGTKLERLEDDRDLVIAAAEQVLDELHPRATTEVVIGKIALTAQELSLNLAALRVAADTWDDCSKIADLPIRSRVHFANLAKSATDLTYKLED